MIQKAIAGLLACGVAFCAAACAADTEPFGITDTLKLSVDLGSVACPQQAEVYRASPAALDPARFCGALFQNEVTDETVYAEGPWYGARRSGDAEGEFREVMTTVDAGKAFQGNNGPIFGFNYLNFDTPARDLYSIFSRFLSDQFQLDELRAYAETKELPFCPLADALTEAQQALKDAGLPETQCVFAEGFTAGRLQALEAAERVWGDDEKPSITDDYDCYLFLFRQYVGDFPLCRSAFDSYPYNKGIDVVNHCGAQSIYVIYTKSGIGDLHVFSPVVIGEREGVYDVLPVRRALEPVVEQYKSTTCEASLVFAEFCYIVIFDNDQNARLLLPCWQFTVREEYTFIDPETKKEIKDIENITYRVNAVTGKFVPMDDSIDIAS